MENAVSVSSSDRGVMQVFPIGWAVGDRQGFSILIGSGGDASRQNVIGTATAQRFSILIGSGGDASRTDQCTPPR